MKENFSIKSWCRITNEKIICDDEVLLENQADNLSDFLKDGYRLSKAEYPKFHKMDLMCKAAFLATEFISKKETLFETNTALLLSNQNASWVSDEKHANSLYIEDETPSPAVFVYTLPNIALGEISIRHQLLSENLFLIFDRFSPENLVPYANQVLEDKKADKVLAGWVEVEENKLDILIYLVDKQGINQHSIKYLTNLYINK